MAVRERAAQVEVRGLREVAVRAQAAADVKAAVAATGIQMPVLVDDGDVLYDRLGIRLHPMVGIVDQKAVLAAMEPYRQIDYCDVIRTRIKVLLGEATAADLERIAVRRRFGEKQNARRETIDAMYHENPLPLQFEFCRKER